MLTSQPVSESLPERQRAALISLLADDDPAIYQLVRQKLLSYGASACDWLRPQLLSSDPVLRRRAQEIVRRLGRQRCDERFLDYCLHHGEDLDLEEAMGLLAQTQYPDLNWPAYRALWDLWAEQLREQIDFKSDVEEVLNQVNQFLFEDLGFVGQEHAGHNPENCYLNRVMDRRIGNPISLCVIYMFVTRRLHLPVCGISLPGHFICRYQSSTKECYIDAFRRGKFWTKADCIRHLLSTQHGVQDGYLTPISARRILLRMCATLHQTYAHLEMAEESTRVQKYLLALAK